MQLSEARATELRDWVIKRLENISDADPDVLAEYVLALLRSDAPDDTVQKSATENLEDFLKEHTRQFVNELFSTFVPKAEPAISTTDSVQPTPSAIPGLNNAADPPDSSTPIEAYDPTAPLDLSNKAVNGIRKSRKRPYNDRFDSFVEQDPQYAASDRKLKATRGSRGGRDDRNVGQSLYSTSTDPRQRKSIQRPSFSGMPAPPTPPPGFPSFDPNDPVGSMLAMQAMFPQMNGTKSFNGPLPPKINQRCRDYDVKGYCVLGSQCPYDHGNAPVVAIGKSEGFSQNTGRINADQPVNGYNGRGASSRGRGSERGARRGDQGYIQSPRDNRATFSDPKPNYDMANTTIVVEQIPEENFDEENVRDFFFQFGNVKNVSMRPYKRLAVVQYNDYGAARRAYESPKVIFDNRFVKVYWYKASEDSKINGTSSRKSSAVPRTSSSQQSPVTPNETVDQSVLLAQQGEAQKAYEAKALARKEMEEAKASLAQKQEEMARKHDSERTQLLAKIAAKEGRELPADESEDSGAIVTNGNTKAAQDDKVNRALREQLAKLEAEAKSLGIDPDAPSEEPYPYSSPSYRGYYRGRGVANGRFATRGKGGRGAFRGSGGWTAPRGGSSVKRLDNRPKRVAVSGVEWTPERDECLREHLISTVQFESIDPNPDRPDSLIVSFRERYMAEMLKHGKSEIPGIGTVELSWVAGPLPASSASASEVATTMNGSHARNRSDWDVEMLNGGGSEDGRVGADGNGSVGEGEGEVDGGDGGKELGQSHDVEYDVAEDHDWGIE
ncbi:MAG: hypothetical protein Q9160_008169 [Pyrenula sp. 1 TL-2023]